MGEHVFPTQKYPLIYKTLKERYKIPHQNFREATPASDEDILLVHNCEYLNKLKNMRLSFEELIQLEIPLTREVLEAAMICVQGTIIASGVALEEKIGIHIGGGFHHAFPDHGEGFCIFNDEAVAIRKLQKENLIKRALVIDCDLHQGNGTAYIFKNDSSVFTFSIHQQNNYPFYKPPSNLDIGLPDGVGDETYLNFLKDNIPRIIKEFKPDFIMYQAGADPYERDQLGGLRLTKVGLRKRDEIIFAQAKKNNVPITVVLGGGYAYNISDTVQIHCNTILAGMEMLLI